MHLLFLLSTVTVALVLRLLPTVQPSPTDDIAKTWGTTVLRFSIPPLLLLTTALALVGMGPRHMHGWWQDRMCHGIAVIGLLTLGAVVIGQLLKTVRLLRPLKDYPQILIDGHLIRWLPTDAPFAAETGLWQTEYLISQGLLTTLSREQQSAVLAHEAGHRHYRDTFWFFWLGCLRHWSCWLPQTDSLWQTLLTLRELRADRFAAHSCDRLTLAEALFDVASGGQELAFTHQGMAALCDDFGSDRLALRIEALLEEHYDTPPTTPFIWQWLLSVTLPFSVVPLCACW